MKTKFEVIFLEEARHFLLSLDRKPRSKIIYVIERSRTEINPIFFKKINRDIWEYRILFQNMHYRFFAFWDKTDHKKTLVLVSHAFIKKTSGIPLQEIRKAQEWRIKYFNQKI